MLPRLSWLLVSLAIAMGPGVDAAFAQRQHAPLRLKSGVFVPPANVGPEAPAPRAFRRSESHHLLIQFDGPVTPRDVAALRRLGLVSLRYVPDHALIVRVPAGFDAARIPRARWIGTLSARDRISETTAADLEREHPRHDLTLVEFYAGLPEARMDRALGAAGLFRISTPHLPARFSLVPTHHAALERLAEDDAVAWIYPASPDVLAPHATICPGLLRPAGIVSEAATVGDGWDGPGLGSARLGYHLQTPSRHLPGAVQAAEITRAMEEWSRAAAIEWQPASGPYAERSITLLWAAGDHGDGYPFTPDVLAHAFYPAPPSPEPIGGDVHFNEDFLWGSGDPGRYDVFSVTLHELGHSLGLAHTTEPESVMYPVYRGIVQALTPVDVAAIRQLYAPPVSSPSGSAWSVAAIGASMGGGFTTSGGMHRLSAAGQDVWGTYDEFRFASRALDGDGDIVARIDRLDGVHRWTKAGVMIREDDAPAAPHAFMLVSHERGLAFQRRQTRGGATLHTDGGAGTAPRWLWLARRGDRIHAYAARDGGAWQLVGADTIRMGATVRAGLAVTSHEAGVLATATFSNVSVTRLLPATWTGRDIGQTQRAGSWGRSGTSLTVTGAGDDIWGTADAFHYVWQPLDGDGEILARVASIENVDRWSKAGVMVREDTAAGSPHAFMLASASRGFAFQRRTRRGGISTHTSGGDGTAPGWVRLTREGDRFTAYRSADGLTWTLVGTETIPMRRGVLVGVAVTSHLSTATCQAVFQHVEVRVPVP